MSCTTAASDAVLPTVDRPSSGSRTTRGAGSSIVSPPRARGAFASNERDVRSDEGLDVAAQERQLASSESRGRASPALLGDARRGRRAARTPMPPGPSSGRRSSGARPPATPRCRSSASGTRNGSPGSAVESASSSAQAPCVVAGTPRRGRRARSCARTIRAPCRRTRRGRGSAAPSRRCLGPSSAGKLERAPPREHEARHHVRNDHDLVAVELATRARPDGVFITRAARPDACGRRSAQGRIACRIASTDGVGAAGSTVAARSSRTISASDSASSSASWRRTRMRTGAKPAASIDREVPPGPFHVEEVHGLAEDIRLRDLDGRVAAPVQHERGLSPEEARRVHPLGEGPLEPARVVVVPEASHPLASPVRRLSIAASIMHLPGRMGIA